MGNALLRFLFLSEGSSEAALTPHLEQLCIEAGAAEARGLHPDLGRLPRPPGKRVADQLRAALQWEREIDLVFIHRDSDRVPYAQRYQEIHEAVAVVDHALPWVPVIAVQEIEAWLLLDERAIREVAGNPRGKTELGLPKMSAVEVTASPKEILREALARASGHTGRRLDGFRKDFALHRRQLIERLELDGSLTDLPAWKAMVAAVHQVVGNLALNA